MNADGQSPDSSGGILARLLEILAPGGNDMTMLIEAYFDESGSHDDSPVLSVAGYIFHKPQCVELDRKWQSVLDRFSLPYFRMSACAHHTKPFDTLSLPDCIDVETQMIHLIKQYASFGVAVSVCEPEFNRWFPRNEHVPNAYSVCCWMCLVAVKSWITRNQLSGKVAYFFES